MSLPVAVQKTFGKFGQFFSAFRLSNKLSKSYVFTRRESSKNFWKVWIIPGAKKPRRFYFKLSKT